MIFGGYVETFSVLFVRLFHMKTPVRSTFSYLSPTAIVHFADAVQTSLFSALPSGWSIRHYSVAGCRDNSDLFPECDIHWLFYLKDRVITPELKDWSHEYARISSVRIEEADLSILLSQEPEGVEKILLMGEESALDQLAPVLRQCYGEKVHITKSKPCFLEITDSSVNKGVALAALAEHFGIDRSEVMAIGDSFNDLEMINYAGLGVAMGNARPEIKEQADIVTATNEEDGVAEAIERYVLSGG